MGPSAIRIATLAEQLGGLGVTVVDKGDIPTPLPETKGPGDPRKRYVKEIAKVCQRLSRRRSPPSTKAPCPSCSAVTTRWAPAPWPPPPPGWPPASNRSA